MPEQKVTVLATLQDKLSPGLATIGGALGGLQRNVDRLARAFAPLNSRIAQIATSVGLLSFARKAISAAEKQTEAEQSLSAALQGRVEATRELIELTGKIQSRTIFADEDLIKQAAILRNMGVAVSEVDDALQAAVDTSAALGVNLELAVRGIGRSITQGSAGLLGQRVPILTLLQREGTLAARVLDVLREKYGGFAEQLAQTDFGRRKQILNEIGDVFEKIGNVLVRIVNPALKAGLGFFTRLQKVVEGNTFSVLVQLFEQAAPALIKVAGALASIATFLLSIRGIAFIFGPALLAATSLLGIVVNIGSLLFTWPGIIALFVAKLLQVSGLGRTIGDTFARALSSIRGFFGRAGDIIGRIFSGDLSLEAVFRALRQNAAYFSLAFDQLVATPVSAFMRGLFRTVDGFFTTVVSLIGGVAATLVFEGKKAVNEIGQFFTKTLLDIAVPLGDKISGQISTNLAATALRLQEERLALEFGTAHKAQLRARKLFDEGLRDLRSGLPDAFAESRSAMEQGIVFLDAAFNEFNRTLEQEQRDVLRQKFQLITQEILAEKRKNAAILEDGRSLQAKLVGLSADTQRAIEASLRTLDVDSLSRLVADVDQETADKLKELVLQVSNQRLESGEIEAREYFEIRRRVEDDILATQIANQRELIRVRTEEQRKLEEKLEKATLNRSVAEDIANELPRFFEGAALQNELVKAGEKLVELRQKENEAAFKARDAVEQQLKDQERLLTLGIDRANLEQGLVTTLDTLAKKQEEAAEKARARLSEQRQEVEALLSSGAITQTEAQVRLTEAARVYQTTLDETIAKTTQLLGIVPAADESVRALIASLQRVRAEFALPAPKGFFASIEQGAKEQIRLLGNLGRAGQNIGRALVDGVAGLATVWLDANQSFKEYAANFLRQIAAMIVQAQVFAAIARLFPGAAAGGTATVPATVDPGLRVIAAEGGSIPGLNRGYDSVRALLTPGEYVQPVRSTSYYGHKNMEALRRRMIPRWVLDAWTKGLGSTASAIKSSFATGGPAVAGSVGAFQSASPSRGLPSQAYIPPDRQALRRLFRGDPQLFAQLLNENRSLVRTLSQR